MMRLRSMLQSSRGATTTSTTAAPISSTTTGGGDKNKTKDEDCPVCEEYTAGVCGTEFQAWLDCTNRHEKDYREKCMPEYIEFEKCTERAWRDNAIPVPPPDESEY